MSMHKSKKFDGPKFRREINMGRHMHITITYVKDGTFDEMFTTEYHDTKQHDETFAPGRRPLILKRAVALSAIYYLSMRSDKAQQTYKAAPPLCEYLVKLFPDIKLESVDNLPSDVIIMTDGDALRMVNVLTSSTDISTMTNISRTDIISAHYAPWVDQYICVWGAHDAPLPAINAGAVKYHNNTTREFGWYKHDIIVPEHLRSKSVNVCNCYDCMFEITVWTKYLIDAKQGAAILPELLERFDLTESLNDKIISLMSYLPWATNRPPHSSQSIRVQYDKLIDFYPFSIMETSMISNGLSHVINDDVDKCLRGEVWTDAERKFIEATLIAQRDVYGALPLRQFDQHEFQLELYPQIGTELDYHVHTKRMLHRIHIGQRKLLLNEIIFLTNHGHLSDTVVYAGAAAGIHIPLLSRLFPKHKFILWDPARFAIQPTDKIEINNDFFTHEVAKKYNKVLFISDIRSGSENQSFEEFEQEVITNNDWQRDWVHIMKSPMAMLKFRVPFTAKSAYKYLAGEIYMQPWAPVDSAETRLITDGTQETEYDVHDYENRTFYLNNVTREFTYFAHDIPTTRVHGLCHCYDCAYEIWIWRHYFTSFAKLTDPTMINEAIIDVMNQASAIIGRSLFGGVHGLYANLPMLYKRPLLREIAAATAK